MIGLAHIKTALGRYAALWVISFLAAGAGILIGMLFDGFVPMTDRVVPVVMGLGVLALGVGLVMSLLNPREGPGTKIIVALLAILLVLPLLWASMSAAVAIAWVIDYPIEYSRTYATLQINVARVLYPLGEWFGSGDVFDWVWRAFQVASSIVGFISAWVRAWPTIRRMLSPEPPAETEAEGSEP